MIARRGLLGLACASTAPVRAQAPTRWDVALPWGATEFHTVNAGRFANEVRAATNGAVQMTIHAGGSLGVRVNETVRALGDGVVPMAEFAGFLNVGDVPLMGIESIPFLVGNPDELRVLHAIARPAWERELERRSVVVLYMVPWPQQIFFVKRQVATVADLRGVRMRTNDRTTTEMAQRLGMVPQQLASTDIVAALASNRIDGVMTSATTALAQRYQDFLRYGHTTNHIWVTNAMAVSGDAWRRLPAPTRTTIADLAKRLEPEFWEVAKAEHDARSADLRAAGMTVEDASLALVQAMRDATAGMAEEFARTVPAAAPLIREFRQRVGRA